MKVIEIFSACIPNSAFCDDVPDCVDLSDEKNCKPHKEENCFLQHIENGYPTHYVANQILNFTCFDNFRSRNGDKINSLLCVDGVWDPPLSGCPDIVQCKEPEETYLHAQLLNYSTNFGDFAFYYDKRFPARVLLRQCSVGKTGSWFDVNFYANEMQCFPQSVMYGSLPVGSYLSKMFAACIDGFEPTNYTAECLTNNTWSFTEPLCKPISYDDSVCRKMGDVHALVQTFEDFPGNFSCSCSRGYMFSHMTCEKIPQCRYNKCDMFSTCKEGINDYTCECHEGYTTGSDKYTCYAKTCDIPYNMSSDIFIFEAGTKELRSSLRIHERITIYTAYNCTTHSTRSTCPQYPVFYKSALSCAVQGNSTIILNEAEIPTCEIGNKKFSPLQTYEFPCNDKIISTACGFNGTFIGFEEGPTCENLKCICLNGNCKNTSYCNCHEGFTGKYCEIKISSQSCNLTAAGNDSKCVYVTDGSQHIEGQLICISQLPDPKNRSQCKPFNACDESLISCNGLQCKQNLPQPAVCDCGSLSDVNGEFCQNSIYCAENSYECKNGGICQEYDRLCNCIGGFEGDACKFPSNKCYESPCQHSTICSPLLYGYFCKCFPEYQGYNCGLKITNEYNFCVNGNLSSSNTFACECDPNWTGPSCDKYIDQCPHIYPNNNIATCTENYAGEPILTCKQGFEGEYCYSTKKSVYCDLNPCQNFGVCYEDLAIDYFICYCAPMYYGKFCELPIGRGANSPSLLDSTFHNITEQDLIVKFNRHSKQISSHIFSIDFKKPLTILAWAFCDAPNKESTFMSIMKGSSQAFSLGCSVLYSLIVFPFVKPGWNQFCFIFENFNVYLYVNTVLAWSQTVQANATVFASVANYTIVLAPYSSQIRYTGMLSKVEFYDKGFTDNEIQARFTACHYPTHTVTTLSVPIVAWPQSFLDSLKSDTTVQTVMPGVCTQFGLNRTRPIALYCPPDKRIISESYLIDDVTWDAPVFVSDKPISISSNFRNQSTYAWGIYDIIIRATQDNNFFATCEFQLTVAPGNCSVVNTLESGNITIFDLPPGTNALQAVNVSCGKNHPNISPAFYVCDNLGQWDRWHSLPRNLPFTPRSCGEVGLRMQIFTGSVEKTCAPLDDMLRNLTNYFCNKTDCVPSIQDEHCKYSITNGLQFSLQIVSCETVDFESFVQNSTCKFAPDIKNSSVCPIGSYWKEELCFRPPKCELCSRDLSKCWCKCGGNSFCNESNECEECAPGMIVLHQPNCAATPANVSCISNCSSGQFFNLSSHVCEDCPLDFYQPKAGSISCLPCGFGTRTSSKGAMSFSDCVSCDDGKELFKTGCEACPVNTYQDGKSNALQCTQCPYGVNWRCGTKTNEKQQATSSCFLAFCGADFEPRTCISCNLTLIEISAIKQDCVACKPGFSTLYPANASNVLPLNCPQNVARCGKCPNTSYCPTAECDSMKNCSDPKMLCVDFVCVHPVAQSSHSSLVILISIVTGSVGAICLFILVFALFMWMNKRRRIQRRYQRDFCDNAVPKVYVETYNPKVNKTAQKIGKIKNFRRSLSAEDCNDTTHLIREHSEKKPWHSAIIEHEYYRNTPRIQKNNLLLPIRESFPPRVVTKSHPVEVDKLPPPIITNFQNSEKNEKHFSPYSESSSDGTFSTITGSSDNDEEYFC